MAYVNVREWSPDQVTEWLRGILCDIIIIFALETFISAPIT